ncbi:MAG: hypothetical protein EXR68_06940 [Dehalococcoidia bacterium]|nr:hypothetical protein [Dehalococcoidia bacterium]
MIDNGVDLDLMAVRQNVADAEVITVYFPLIGRALFVDARSSADVSTMVRVVPMARNTAERLHSLRRLHPMLPRPESITMIPWQMRIDTMVSTGVWDCLLRRINDGPAAAACFSQLQTLERAEQLDAILGRRYEAFWTRVGAREPAEEDER